MKRAAVILSSNELNPFYGIVFFEDIVDDGVTVTPMESGLDEAVKAHFREHWEAPEGDSPDDWFEDILGDYTYFYISMEVASRLADVKIPIADVGHLNNSDDAAQVLLEQLMIDVCEEFSYTDRFPRLK